MVGAPPCLPGIAWPLIQPEDWLLAEMVFISALWPGRGFPDSSVVKKLPAVGDLGLIPWSGRSAREGKGYPLQYSGLENSMDCTVHGVAKSHTTGQGAVQ